MGLWSNPQLLSPVFHPLALSLRFDDVRVEIPSGTPPRMPADTDLDQRRDTDGYGTDGDPQVVTIL